MENLKSLIIRAQTGDSDAFGTIVRQFQDIAVGYAYSILGDFHLAQDAAQEAFIGVYRDLPMLREPDAFPSWLKRLVFKHCNRLTRGMRIQTVPLEEAVEMPSSEKGPADATEEREMKDNVLAAIQALPENERMVTTLFYINGYSHQEIADFLEIPATTVNHRLRASRKRLKVALDPDLIGERLITMVQENLQEQRPSKDDRFANAVQLFSAIESGHVAKVKELLSSDATLISANTHTMHGCATTVLGATPLHVAAGHGHKDIVELLLAKGADVNVKSSDGRTPLHCVASFATNFEVAEFLLDKGADINAKDEKGETPLCLAVRCVLPWNEPVADHWGMSDFLVKKSAEVDIFSAAGQRWSQSVVALLRNNPTLANARNADGETPLHWAARTGASETAMLLLAHGAEVNAKDQKGRTPLYVGAQTGTWRWHPSSSVGRLLLDYGAEVDIFSASILGMKDAVQQRLDSSPGLLDARDPDGATPLCLAAWNGRKDVVELLLEKGADVNAKDNQGRSPISVRYEWADYHDDIAELLLEHGAKIDLNLALALGKTEAVKVFLEKDPSLVKGIDLKGRSQKMVEILLAHGTEADICQAAALGMKERVEALLQENPELVNAHHDGTPLHQAAENGHLEIVKLLVANKADVNARNAIGSTPLHYASLRGHERVVAYLLKHGADIHAEDNFHNPTLAKAVMGNFPNVVKLLLDHGADPNGGGMWWAAEKGFCAVGEILIAHGADVNAGNLLHTAAANGQTAFAELLLKHGADPYARDSKGRTARQVALERGLRGVADGIASVVRIDENSIRNGGYEIRSRHFF